MHNKINKVGHASEARRVCIYRAMLSTNAWKDFTEAGVDLLSHVSNIGNDRIEDELALAVRAILLAQPLPGQATALTAARTGASGCIARLGSGGTFEIIAEHHLPILRTMKRISASKAVGIALHTCRSQ